MAALAVLSPSVDKTSNMLPTSAAILPKKRAPIAGGLTRTRFAKARPNIGALVNKSAKETPVSTKEKVLPQENPIKTKEISSAITPSLEKTLETDTISLKENASSDAEEKVLENVSTANAQPIEKESEKERAISLLPVAECQVVSLPEAASKEVCIEDNSSPTTPSSKTVDEGVLPQETVTSPVISSNAVTTAVSSLALVPTSVSSPAVVSIPVTPPTAIQTLAVIPSHVNTIALPAPKTPVKHTDYPTLKGILNSPRKRFAPKKSHEKRKRFANGAEPPPRSEMTIADLIYFNPLGTTVKVRKTNSSGRVIETPAAEVENNAVVPVPEKREDPPASSNPQVTINEKGEIVLDESSLVVKRIDTIDHSLPALVEDDNTTYSSFRSKASKQWTTKETTKFYKALKLVGTDFALMEKIFEVNGKVTRTRKELKCKYKREEKLNTLLVNQAIYDTQTFEISILEDDADDPDDPVIVKKDTKSRKKKKNPSPEPAAPLESYYQNGNSSAADVDPIIIPEDYEEISVQINGNLYPQNESDSRDTESIPNQNVSTADLYAQLNDDVPVIKKRGRKKKVKIDVPGDSSQSSWEDTSEIYHFPDVSNRENESAAFVQEPATDLNEAKEGEGQGSLSMEIVCFSDKTVSNLIQMPEHWTTNDNFCTDGAISEVVTSYSQPPRRGKRKTVMPIVGKRTKKRPLPQYTETKSVPLPSFSSFTPCEEGPEDSNDRTLIVEESEDFL